MKRIYRQLKRRSRFPYGPGILVSFALLLALLFALKKQTGLVFGLEKPFLKLSFLIRTISSDLELFLKSKSDLASKLKEAQNKLTELENQNSILVENLNEIKNADLLFSDPSEPGRAALVLYTNTAGPIDTLTLDLGKNDGIEIGYKVMAFGIYLGTVDEVFANTSRATLISAPHKNSFGYLEPAGINVSLEGIGAGNMKFTLPKSLNVKLGDRIFTDSRPLYLIGQIEHIKEESAEPLVKITTRFPLNLENLRFVELKP